MEAFKGAKIQRGHGLGNVFKIIARVAWPLLKPILSKGAKKVGKTVIRAGKDIADDVLKGDHIKHAAKRRMKQGIDALLSQRGQGIKRVCRREKSSITHRLRRKTKAKPRYSKMKHLMKKSRSNRRRKKRSHSSMPPGVRAALKAHKHKRISKKRKGHKRRRKSNHSLTLKKRVVRRRSTKNPFY